MSAHWVWWIAAAALLAAEVATGTFYLLVLGLAVACAGVAAWIGWHPSLQWLTAGVLALIGTMALHRWKRRLSASTPQQPPLDVGQMVQVKAWGPENTARVAYRGSTWDAELASPNTTRAESMYIAAMRGSTLILSDQRPAVG
jgi:membrane protein implicated in regulation of membrane protease activity